MFAESYISTASRIFAEYSLQQPLSIYLKLFFKANPRFGSRDRKFIAELLYGIYRLGREAEHLTVRERLLSGSFLSGVLPLLFFEKTEQSLARRYHLSFVEKKMYLSERFNLQMKVPFALSANVSEDEYIAYLFQSSRVFIRIRSQVNKIIAALQSKGVSFEVINDQCISLPANTKIQELLPQVQQYVIQDFASQLSGQFFNPVAGEYWWDCCAASGGKSLLLLEKNVPVHLTVSDIRSSTIENLHVRFRQYGHTAYKASVIDAVNPLPSNFVFDKMIADVPCSGAGTWGRNPEQFYFFTPDKLQAFHNLQCSILHNVLGHLKKDGRLYYFTCSIFQHENEAVVNSIDTGAYTIVQQHLLKGFQYGGDCLFFCEIKKNEVPA